MSVPLFTSHHALAHRANDGAAGGDEATPHTPNNTAHDGPRSTVGPAV